MVPPSGVKKSTPIECACPSGAAEQPPIEKEPPRVPRVVAAAHAKVNRFSRALGSDHAKADASVRTESVSEITTRMECLPPAATKQFNAATGSFR
eukprot:CAMPEP_0181187324 /NCGR_PEP_ID=MMETSP1096-20121128/10510_1 /TAXON_ID=156174 ORGANISM="Chrysochromulina ericina, Strain CCMP281" /NCGR_SAMPLE_ID=MMETSP1096 /ASSEMBLY_ACC=CAM_ASM_000453 /LENGTH=94 /DNA_ID=CAMNT_0023276287 /DNA_START=354 /DNA_END=635 /DNA_ORIENTATION=-